jgi:hypothetical protein
VNHILIFGKKDLFRKENKMESISFYNFDLTSGSSIQAEALFDIFDDLASLRAGKKTSTVNPVERSNRLGNVNTNKKGYP